MEFRYRHSILLLWLIVSPMLLAQNKKSVDSLFDVEMNNPDSKFRESVLLATSDLNTVRYELEKAELESEIARQRYFKRQYDDYYTKSLKQRWDSFNWQYRSSRIIFWFVILIMVSGLFFASVQFYISYKIVKSTTNKLDRGGDSDPAKDEIEVSLSGIKVKSSVLGVIILVISIAFFYLYLVHIYPINPVKI